MKFYGVVLVAICISATLAEPPQLALFNDVEKFGSRITEGTPADRYEFKYQISLTIYGQHICGGSILTQNWVLTAGHCIIGSVRDMKVIAGMLDQNENHPDVQTRRILRQITHPSFPGGVAPYDITLLRLALPLRWSEAVQPISLPQQYQEFSGLAWVSGWGYLNSSNPVTPTTLQKVQLQIWSFDECANNLIGLTGGIGPLDDSMLCLGGPVTGREAVCQGDSGGPVAQDGKLLGVASWTVIPCGMLKTPSVYTKVSQYVDWIKFHLSVV